MVRYAGLPLVWAHTGTVALPRSCSGSASTCPRSSSPRTASPTRTTTTRGRPTDDDDPIETPRPEQTDAGPGCRASRPVSDTGMRRSRREATPQPGAPTSEERRALGIDRRALKRAGSRLALRSTALLVVGLMLALPTARAAFAAITGTTAEHLDRAQLGLHDRGEGAARRTCTGSSTRPERRRRTARRHARPTTSTATYNGTPRTSSTRPRVVAFVTDTPTPA